MKTKAFARSRLALHAESGEGLYEPLLKRVDEGAHIGAAPFHVEHNVGDALTRAVIGDAAASPGLMYGKPLCVA